MTDEELERLLDERDVWRERAERAEAKLASITGMARQELARTTAEAQREACAEAIQPTNEALAYYRAAEIVRATPLVTEVES